MQRHLASSFCGRLRITCPLVVFVRRWRPPLPLVSARWVQRRFPSPVWSSSCRLHPGRLGASLAPSSADCVRVMGAASPGVFVLAIFVSPVRWSSSCVAGALHRPSDTSGEGCGVAFSPVVFMLRLVFIMRRPAPSIAPLTRVVWVRRSPVAFLLRLVLCALRLRPPPTVHLVVR